MKNLLNKPASRFVLKPTSKIILSVFFSFIFLNSIHSQKIKYNKDNKLMYVDGKPFIKLVKKPSYFLNNDFSIQSLDGEEFIFMDHKEYRRGGTTVNYYVLHFIANGATVRVNKDLTAKDAVRLILDNNFIIDGGTMNASMDPEAVKRYVRKNNPSSKPEGYILVDRNQILNNGKVIGKHLVKYDSTAAGSMMIIHIFGTSGEKCAVAKALVENAMEWEVFTPKDEKTTSILFEPPNEKEKLFNWLLKKGYFNME